MINKKLKRAYTRFKINFKYAFNLKKPMLMVRIMKDYLDVIVFKKIPLRYVDVAVDYACNLRCLHCSASKFSRQNSEKMSIEDIDRAIADAVAEENK